MQRFVLRTNIKRYERLLEIETDRQKRELIERMLQEAREELALMQAEGFKTSG